MANATKRPDWNTGATMTKPAPTPNAPAAAAPITAAPPSAAEEAKAPASEPTVAAKTEPLPRSKRRDDVLAMAAKIFSEETYMRSTVTEEHMADQAIKRAEAFF